jgi:N-acetyl-anhydromuramyl-L-alanine amidase AmpD
MPLLRLHPFSDAQSTFPVMSQSGAVFALLIATSGLCMAADRAAPAASPAIRQLVAEQTEAREERSWKYIVLHHSAAEHGSVESIDAAHRQRLDANGQPWRGIGYHFVIGNGHGMPDGRIEPTFRWQEQSAGAHAGVAQFNQHGIGICLIGDFEQAAPTAAQLVSLQELIDALRQEYRIDEDAILAHRDLKPTACPGGQFPLTSFRRAEQGIQRTSVAEPVSEPMPSD